MTTTRVMSSTDYILKIVEKAFDDHWKVVHASIEKDCCSDNKRAVIWNQRVLLRRMLEQIAGELDK